MSDANMTPKDPEVVKIRTASGEESAESHASDPLPGAGNSASADDGKKPRRRFKQVRQPWIARHAIAVSFVLAVLVPTFAALVYFGLVASDKYASTMSFAVRTSNSGSAGSSTGLLAAISGAPGGSISESYIVANYLQSQELLVDLESEINLREIYSRPDVDYFSRINANLPSEDLHQYWLRQLTVTHDTTADILTVEAVAFRKQDVLTIGEKLLQLSETLVNELSERARTDTVQGAEQQLEKAEARLRAARAELRNFRERERAVDPSAMAQSRAQIIGTLEAELAKRKSELVGLQTYLDNDAPSVVFLSNQIAALTQRITEERDALTGTSSEQAQLGRVLQQYEELQLELEFAQKSYATASATLEFAQVNATKQQLYITPIDKPKLPEYARYPNRPLNILLAALICFIFWAIGLLLYNSLRDRVL